MRKATKTELQRPYETTRLTGGRIRLAEGYSWRKETASGNERPRVCVRVRKRREATQHKKWKSNAEREGSRKIKGTIFLFLIKWRISGIKFDPPHK